jgi:hypothetical protein
MCRGDRAAGANMCCMTKSLGYAAMSVSFSVLLLAIGLSLSLDVLFEGPAASAIVDSCGVEFGSIIR